MRKTLYWRDKFVLNGKEDTSRWNRSIEIDVPEDIGRHRDNQSIGQDYDRSQNIRRERGHFHRHTDTRRRESRRDVDYPGTDDGTWKEIFLKRHSKS